MISLGFYFSRDSLCIAEVTVSSNQPKVLAIHETFFSETSSQEDKQNLLAQEIEKIKAKHKGTSLRFCYTLAQSAVSSFPLKLPFKERFKILKTIPFEVEDRTPFQADKIFFDARMCQIETNNSSSVLCFITPEDNVTDFMNFVQALKKDVHLLSCSAVCLANLLETWNVPLLKAQNPHSTGAFIFLGIENSYLLFYKQGFLSHVSILDWGCLPIVEEMQHIYKLDGQKAWVEFFQKAFLLTEVKGFTKEQVFFSNLVKKHVEGLIPKLKLLKMSLETKQNLVLSEAIIFGQGAMIKNLSSFLSTQLDMSVSKLKQVPAFPKWDWQSYPFGLIATGLALEGLKRSPYPGLDFLHVMKKQSFIPYPKFFKKWTVVALVSFVLFFTYVFIKKQETVKVLAQVQEVFVAYGQKIAYLSQTQINPTTVRSFLNKEQIKLEDEKTVQEELNLKNPMDYLEKIVQRLGSAKDWNLKIQYLKVSGKKIEIRGFVENSKFETFKTAVQKLSLKNLNDKNSETENKKLNDSSVADVGKTNLDSSVTDTDKIILDLPIADVGKANLDSSVTDIDKIILDLPIADVGKTSLDSSVTDTDKIILDPLANKTRQAPRSQANSDSVANNSEQKIEQNKTDKFINTLQEEPSTLKEFSYSFTLKPEF